MTLWRWVERLPSTNARIVVTLLLALATGIRVIASANWDPPDAWLTFIIALSVSDGAQFTAKRITQKPQPAAPEPGA